MAERAVHADCSSRAPSPRSSGRRRWWRVAWRRRCACWRRARCRSPIGSSAIGRRGASGGAIEGGARPTMRAATRGGGMPLPRPWYEVDADEDAIWPQQAARSAAASAARAAGVQATAAAATTTTATAAAAERGAAIARTALTAAPDVVARAIDAADDERPGALATSAVAVELRAAEALGLRASATTSTTATATPTATWAPAARATTPLGRALAHAAWVDAQLRTVAAPVETAARGRRRLRVRRAGRCRARRRAARATRRRRRRRVRRPE